MAEARQSTPPSKGGRSKLGYVAQGVHEPPKAYASQPTPSESSSCSAQRASSGKSARDLVLQRFCGDRANGEKQVDSRALILNFLSFVREDGYISAEEHEELAKAVADLSSQSQKRSASIEEAREMASSNAMAAFFVAPTGKIADEAPKGSKERGSFVDAPTGALLVQSGVNADAILSDRTFNCRTCVNIPLDAAVIAHGFQHPVNYASRYDMDVGRLEAWLLALAAQYNDDPAYHNWRHAFDTFQLCFLSLQGGLTRYINYQDSCSILIAAIAHDVGHQGQNNAWHLKTGTELAIRYNDRSPLENMHASLAFETLRKPEMNFLASMKSEDFANMRMKILDCILETDPSLHFAFVGQLDGRAKQIRKYEEVKGDRDSEEGKQNTSDRRMLVRGFVHMADIGNGLRTWDVYKNLVEALEEEFFKQGDQERELGVPISPMMDRSKDCLAAGQEFFLTKMVLPLFDLYSNFLEDNFNDTCRSNLHSNNKRWQELMKAHGRLPVKDLLALEGSEEKQDEAT